MLDRAYIANARAAQHQNGNPQERKRSPHGHHGNHRNGHPPLHRRRRPVRHDLQHVVGRRARHCHLLREDGHAHHRAVRHRSHRWLGRCWHSHDGLRHQREPQQSKQLRPARHGRHRGILQPELSRVERRLDTGKAGQEPCLNHTSSPKKTVTESSSRPSSVLWLALRSASALRSYGG